VPASPGTCFGPYEIVELIGRGGMGEVYRARDLRLGRDVAIKILPEAFSADRDRLRRFEQEARATALLNHANIVSIYDVGTHEGQPYLVSELLEGQTLRTILRAGVPSVDIAIRYALQLCQGLAAAHARGIAHRDLKPENLLVTSDGRLKILDFGLAKLVKRSSLPVAPSHTTLSATTAPGVILGTIGYMSPEQLRGEATDHRSDIFSFGAILYEMITGQRAFQAENPIETMYAILKTDPPSFSRPGDVVRNALDAIVGRCLEKSPNDRFQTVGEIFKLRSTQVLLALPADSGVPGDASLEGDASQEDRLGKPYWIFWLSVGFILLTLILGAAPTIPIWADLSPVARFVALLLTVIALHLGGGAVWHRSPDAAEVIHLAATLSMGVAVLITIQIFDLEGYWPTGVLLWALGAWAGWKVLDDATHFGLAAVLAPAGLVGEWELVTREARVDESLHVLATGLVLIALAYFMAPDDKQFAVRGRLLRWLGGLALVPAAFVLVTSKISSPGFGKSISPGWLALGWTLAIGAPTAVAVILRKRAAWMNAVAAGWVVVAVAIPIDNPAAALLLIIWFAIGALALSASGIGEARIERINVGSIILAISLLCIAALASRLAVGWAVVPLVGACLWFLERTRRRMVRTTMGQL
jgi:protein kinase-like protein/predicted membrane protein DUF2157